MHHAQAVDLGPLHVNAHSGCDAWEEATDALRFFEGAMALQARVLPSGTRLSHETHRGRPLGHPFVAGRLLERLPDLRITADLAHWAVVGERLLRCPSSPAADDANDTEARLMLLAAERTDHVRGMMMSPGVGLSVCMCVYLSGAVDSCISHVQVHARVGSSQHPQVADPTDRKRFGNEVAAHMAFWEEVSAGGASNCRGMTLPRS